MPHWANLKQRGKISDGERGKLCWLIQDGLRRPCCITMAKDDYQLVCNYIHLSQTLHPQCVCRITRKPYQTTKQNIQWLGVRYKVETPCCISAVHLYSPSTNSWVRMSSGDLPLPRSYAAATQLQKGEVIFVGGLEGIRKPTVTDMRQVRGTETGIKCNEPTRHEISHQMSHSHSLHYKHYQKLGGQPTVCNRLWCLGQT